jgi:hypothetical protein
MEEVDAPVSVILFVRDDQSSWAKGQNECSWIITQHSSLTPPLRLSFILFFFQSELGRSRGTSYTLFPPLLSFTLLPLPTAPTIPRLTFGAGGVCSSNWVPRNKEKEECNLRPISLFPEEVLRFLFCSSILSTLLSFSVNFSCFHLFAV